MPSQLQGSHTRAKTRRGNVAVLHGIHRAIFRNKIPIWACQWLNLLYLMHQAMLAVSGTCSRGKGELARFD